MGHGKKRVKEWMRLAKGKKRGKGKEKRKRGDGKEGKKERKEKIEKQR